MEEILKWKMNSGLVFKEEIRRKYREDGKNWAAICEWNGRFMNRRFLDYVDFPYVYDFNFVNKEDIVELAYEEYIGGRQPNGWKSRERVKNREYFIVIEKNNEQITVWGGFPQFEPALALRMSNKFEEKIGAKSPEIH